MQCGYPYKTPGGDEVPCGRCMPCRITRQREWVSRLLMEYLESERKLPATFFTLTYDEKHVPKDGSLSKEDLRLFLKRLRAGSMGSIRYFAVGEYGDKTFRPHYHGVLFGVSAPEWEEYINKKWGLGNIKVDDLNTARMRYVTGYVLKKMTQPDDPRLGDKTPEFRVFSNKPPLGAAFAVHLLQFCCTKRGSEYIRKNGDIPMNFRYEGKLYRVPNYWIKWIRAGYGIDRPIIIETEEAIDYEEIKRQTALEARENADNLWAKAIATRRRKSGGAL